MPERVSIGRVVHNGTSVGINLPRDILAQLTWNKGDRIALRCYNGKLVAERIPLEQIALLRASEETAHV
jgi:antitoxin component of MazEF toxin-antitoxin module